MAGSVAISGGIEQGPMGLLCLHNRGQDEQDRYDEDGQMLFPTAVCRMAGVVILSGTVTTACSMILQKDSSLPQGILKLK